MDKLKFYMTNRFILLITSVALFVGIHYLFTNSILPDTSTKNIWFYSGLFMLFFSILFIEPYYSSPKNVITNSIPLLLVYVSVKESFAHEGLWYATISVIGILLITSIAAIAISSDNESPDSTRNKTSTLLKNIAVFFGRGKIIYSFVFISVLILYKAEILIEVSDTYLFSMIILWGFVLIINSQSLHNSFSREKKKLHSNAIGEIFGVQSKKIFLVKLFEDRSKNIKRFDIVKFNYSMQDSDEYAIAGIVFDTYLLNQEKWVKILQLGTAEKDLVYYSKNIVYKVTEKEEVQGLSKTLNVENFVGVVIEKSTIGTIKFEYSKKTDDIQEGDLLELIIGNRRLFYQVISGSTEYEKLESKNETGFIEGEAIQLGEWQKDLLSFQKFGWVPAINTPIFKADTSNIQVQDYTYPDFKLGTIPNTQLPSVINLHEAVSHHLALLGVTGSGKSFLAREVIKSLMTDTNVICIDFTGEYKKDLKPLDPAELIKVDGLDALEENFAEKHKKALNKKPDEELKLKKQIQSKLDVYVKEFIEGENNLGLFELPALSNTSFIIEFTQFFIESVFNYAKSNEGSRICLVLEEAHTIVPETNFLGDLGDYGSTKALVNKMSQIALQGRKYGVGLMVIAQRTANVSKTVLTQCNSIVCFQAFDETSFTFLGNYIGKDLVQTLPNLKRYHAIVTGKAIRSNVPMIVNLARDEE
ncbi:ATP-binding protein [Parapedobacter tibetensis]|uniref:ATP-binding protein n=1 Tax=Parapedobacter tibetensis TaxID=2972951 RepID=UPI00214D3B41|nr:ATP-binding protein [Parapedobacter tibetensis]